jgi:hypothetical protein
VRRILTAAILFASVAPLVLCQSVTPEPTVGERAALDQLRAIVEAIKSCKPFNVPLDAQMESEGFAAVLEPPINVVWNVELHPSVRSQYEGSIEFSEPSYFKLPIDTSYCNKPKIDKNACRRMWTLGMQIYRRQVDHPLQFKYEFDVTDHGAELLSAFKKTKQVDDEPWVSVDVNSDGCASKAIKSVLSNPNEGSNEFNPEKPPAGIPKNLWIAANIGDADAQFYMGNMYEEGKGVPQDYVEAYFWLNIAASGKQATVPQDEIVRARNISASRITPEVLLQTQGRARKWVENHLSQTEQKR